MVQLLAAELWLEMAVGPLVVVDGIDRWVPRHDNRVEEEVEQLRDRHRRSTRGNAVVDLALHALELVQCLGLGSGLAADAFALARLVMAR